MRLPHKIKDKFIQSNFDFITARLAPCYFLAVSPGAGQSVSPGSDTKINYSETSDLFGVFDDPNDQFIAPGKGAYIFQAALALPTPGAVGTRWILRLYVNGGFNQQLKVDWTGSTWSNDYAIQGQSSVVPLNLNDKVDIRVNQASAGAITVGPGFSGNEYFSGFKVG